MNIQQSADLPIKPEDPFKKIIKNTENMVPIQGLEKFLFLSMGHCVEYPERSLPSDRK